MEKNERDALEDISRELTDEEMMFIVGGSKTSARDARSNRGPGGGRGPWG